MTAQKKLVFLLSSKLMMWYLFFLWNRFAKADIRAPNYPLLGTGHTMSGLNYKTDIAELAMQGR